MNQRLPKKLILRRLGNVLSNYTIQDRISNVLKKKYA